MLSCYIVDDETHAIEVLAKYIARTPQIELIGTDEDPLIGLENVKRLQPDITFLDIDMPDLTGLEFANLVNGKTNIVFTTASPHHAIEAYTKNVHDYLLKPVSYERFLISIARLTERLKPATQTAPAQQDEYFYVQSESKAKMVRVNFDDIFYAESMNNYIIIHHNNEKLVAYITMNQLQASLPADRFSRIHRSFIINDQKIKLIDGNQVLLTNNLNADILIGNAYKDSFLAKIQGKTIKKNI